MSLHEETLELLDDLISQGNEVGASQYPEYSVLKVRSELFDVWRVRCLHHLKRLLPPDNEYVAGFDQATGQSLQGPYLTMLRTGVGLLEALKKDIENGRMQRYRQLVAADLFTDFFEQAEHLLDNGYHHPAASLAGAALENGLKEIARDQGITLVTKEDLSTLSGKLADRDVITRLEQKQLSAMADIRNAADHGEFDKVNPEDVSKLIRDASDFLAKHAT